jgi:hypothetical protein
VFHSEVGIDRASESYIEPYIYCNPVAGEGATTYTGVFSIYGVSPRFEHVAQQVSR